MTLGALVGKFGLVIVGGVGGGPGVSTSEEGVPTMLQVREDETECQEVGRGGG